MKKTTCSQKYDGKPKQIRKLNLDGEVFVLGDGYTDYEIKKLVWPINFMLLLKMYEERSVLENADHEAPSLDDFLFSQKLERAHSYPKNRIKGSATGKHSSLWIR